MNTKTNTTTGLLATTALLAALLAMATPANADSLRDVANATQGLTRVSGNIFTGAVYQGSSDGTRNQANPDLVTSTPNPDTITSTANPDTVTVTGGQYVGGGSSEPHIGPSPAANGRGWWNEKCQTIAAVNDDCTVQSMNPGAGGSYSPLVTTLTQNPDTITATANPDTVTATPVPDSVIGTTTTVTVTVDYNPRHGLNGWSVDRTEVTADKP